MNSKQALAQQKIADAYARLEQSHDRAERNEIWREIGCLIVEEAAAGPDGGYIYIAPPRELTGKPE